jgi:hypothetical protein
MASSMQYTRYKTKLVLKFLPETLGTNATKAGLEHSDSYVVNSFVNYSTRISNIRYNIG